MKELRAGMLLGALAGALAGIVETIDVIGRDGQFLFGPGAGFSLTAQILAATITAGAILGIGLGAVAEAVGTAGSCGAISAPCRTGRPGGSGAR